VDGPWLFDADLLPQEHRKALESGSFRQRQTTTVAMDQIEAAKRDPDLFVFPASYRAKLTFCWTPVWVAPLESLELATMFRVAPMAKAEPTSEAIIHLFTLRFMGRARSHAGQDEAYLRKWCPHRLHWVVIIVGILVAILARPMP
jgi:hypothetical protein